MIIDDPTGDAGISDSKDQRETAWRWYRSTVAARVAATQGHWHRNDLMGCLVPQDKEE